MKQRDIEKLIRLRESVKKDYNELPQIFKDKVDAECPYRFEFKNEEEELNWLKRRQSILSSLWAGMMSGVVIIIGSIMAICYYAVKFLEFAFYQITSKF